MEDGAAGGAQGKDRAKTQSFVLDKKQQNESQLQQLHTAIFRFWGSSPSFALFEIFAPRRAALPVFQGGPTTWGVEG